jgi:hypothetical protein
MQLFCLEQAGLNCWHYNCFEKSADPLRVSLPHTAHPTWADELEDGDGPFSNGGAFFLFAPENRENCMR